MKKIIITEGQVGCINGEGKYKLAPFIYNIVKKHATPLGTSKIFPPEESVPFDYSLLKERYKEIVDKADALGFDLSDMDGIQRRYSNLCLECSSIEEQHKTQLQNLAYNVVVDMFSIPIETLNIECVLTQEITPKYSLNIKPEPIDHKSVKYRDVEDIEDSHDAIEKRRILDAIIMGGAYRMSNMDEFYLRDLYRIEKELIPMYEEMDALYQYLLFNIQPKMNDKEPNLDGYVETVLGKDGEKTTIKAQGKTFPILLHELIKGLMELFIAKGLPSDPKRVNLIVRQADYMLAEPWDMRMGVKLWDMVVTGDDGNGIDTDIIPYYLSELSRMEQKEFFSGMREIVSETRSGDNVKNMLLSNAMENMEDNSASKISNKMDVSKNVISDEYMSPEDLENIVSEMTNRHRHGTLLMESQYSTRQGRHAISYMKQHGISDSRQQMQLIDALMNDMEIHNTKDPRFNFLLGITRLYLDGELNSFEAIQNMRTVLKYASDEGHVGQYDENLNGLSLSELTGRFSSLKSSDAARSRETVGKLGFGDSSSNGYRIIRIDSEEQCKQYGKYTSWCITHGSFSRYGLDGENQCYFCLRDGFERVGRSDSPDAPFDEYGLSMVSVIVGYDGEPKYVTTRYNHDHNGENNPELCTAEQVSRLIGVDFYSVFRPNEKGIEKMKMMKKLEEKVNSNGLFVNLGLSVKWCNVNVGASSPEEYGGYYAWGETEEKDEHTEKTYDLEKPFEDVAPRKDIGRMPSVKEFRELYKNCEIANGNCNNTEGLYLISKLNGNVIFLPSAGYRDGTMVNYVGSYGLYWSSTYYSHHGAYYFSFSSSYVNPSSSGYRYYGQSVRSVQD